MSKRPTFPTISESQRKKIMLPNQLPHSTPAAQGIDPAAILAFIDNLEAKQLEVHSFILLRHGYIVAQGWWHPYRAELPHMLFP